MNHLVLQAEVLKCDSCVAGFPHLGTQKLHASTLFSSNQVSCSRSESTTMHVNTSNPGYAVQHVTKYQFLGKTCSFWALCKFLWPPTDVQHMQVTQFSVVRVMMHQVSIGFSLWLAKLLISQVYQWYGAWRYAVHFRETGDMRCNVRSYMCCSMTNGETKARLSFLMPRQITSFSRLNYYGMRQRQVFHHHAWVSVCV